MAMEERREFVTIEVSAQELAPLLADDPDSICLVAIWDKDTEPVVVDVHSLLRNHPQGE